MPRFLVRAIIVLIALIVARGLITGVPPLLKVSTLPGGYDFMGYYTAACLVRDRADVLVYEEAKRPVDPVEAVADPTSAFARTARAHGISEVSLYDYPPTLADLLLPLTLLSSSQASLVWLALNIAFLVIIGKVALRPFRIRAREGAFLLFVFLLCFRATLDCLYFGQIEILLLLLFVIGINLYDRGKVQQAAFLFALAAAIKLIPLILVVPLVAWRDWKTLRAFAFWSLVLVAGLFAINGWQAMDLYFLHELPKMSNSVIDIDNKTLGSAVEVILHRIHEETSLALLNWAGKFAAFCILVVAATLSRTGGTHPRRRIETFAAFMVLSCCLSPVAGLHTYVLAIPAFILLGKHLWENRIGLSEAAVSVILLLVLTTARYPVLKVLTPLAAATLAILMLRRLRQESSIPAAPDNLGPAHTGI